MRVSRAGNSGRPARRAGGPVALGLCAPILLGLSGGEGAAAPVDVHAEAQAALADVHAAVAEIVRAASTFVNDPAPYHEAARRAMTRQMRRGGKVWIRIFPDKPVTAKPAETRMGSGKGAPDRWVAVVKPNRVMFEVGGVEEEDLREALRLASHKLPVACRIVKREEVI